MVGFDDLIQSACVKARGPRAMGMLRARREKRCATAPLLTHARELKIIHEAILPRVLLPYPAVHHFLEAWYFPQVLYS